MAYRGANTKYGSKTTSQIASLTGMQTGDSVFNSDYGMNEYYNGVVWCSNNTITITAGATISEGHLCQIVVSSLGGQAILLNGATQSNATLGIGVCQYGGIAGSTIVLRICGVAKCKVGSSSVTAGEYATMSTSVQGAISSNTSPSIGCIGRVMQTQSASGLAQVFLTFIERQ